MEIEITGEFIKLSQFLKKIDVCPTGGMAKYFVQVHRILINGNLANGRNAKIYPSDTVWIDDNVYLIKEQK